MFYIGIDLGGTTIKVGLVDENYTIVQTAVGPTLPERGAEAVLKDTADLCFEVLNKQGISVEDIDSIGIGSPGMAIPKEGIIKHANNLKFDNVDVRGILNKHIDLPVYVDNDANVAGLGEVICGAAKGKNSAIVVTLGTGVGGAIILDGKIFGGAFFGAGEIGHTTIRFGDGRQCSCGRTGCWEQYASANALISDAKEASEKFPHTKMIAIANGIENINAKIVFDAIEAGDETAQDVLNQYLKYVAHGVTNLINVLQPEIVVIGGGVSAQKEKLTDPIKTFVQEEMYGGLKLDTEITYATLGNDAGIIGAAFLAKYL
ncbi:MAG: glucokinase [Epulopiscium sp. Nele67-Bin005]|nr:MAG: glucokinase [Epulopiscium sp. Nele67-Bin005]